MVKAAENIARDVAAETLNKSMIGASLWRLSAKRPAFDNYQLWLVRKRTCHEPTALENEFAIDAGKLIVLRVPRVCRFNLRIERIAVRRGWPNSSADAARARQVSGRAGIGS
jgi:hypothetical protein